MPISLPCYNPHMPPEVPPRSSLPPGIAGDLMHRYSLQQQRRLARERLLLTSWRWRYALSHPPAPPAEQPVRTILLVERLLRWGDSLVAQPARRLIRQLYPEAHIVSLCLPASRPVVACDPAVAEILECPPAALLHQGKLIAELRSRHFDLAYVLVSDAVSLMLPWRAGIPRSIGYDFNGRGFALSEPRQPSPAANFPAWHSPPPMPVPHVTRLWADLVEPGAAIFPPSIALDEATRAKGEQVWSFAPPDAVRLIIHPGASSANYTWSPDHWRALGEILDKRFSNLAVLVTGSAAEREFVQETMRGWNFPHRIVAGELDFLTLAAAVAHAHATVGPDTSIGHIAAAVGTPAAVLFGPGDHRMWRPAGPAIVVRNNSECWGCKRPLCFQPFTMCTAMTTVEAMADAVEACLAGKARPPEAL